MDELILENVFRQVKDWYTHAAKPEDEKSAEDKAYHMKFKFKTPQSKDSFHKHGHDTKHCGYDSCNSCRADPWSEERGYDDRRDYSRVNDRGGGGAGYGYQCNNERGHRR